MRPVFSPSPSSPLPSVARLGRNSHAAADLQRRKTKPKRRWEGRPAELLSAPKYTAYGRMMVILIRGDLCADRSHRPNPAAKTKSP